MTREPDTAAFERMYLADEKKAREAIEQLVRWWGIDGLVLLGAVERWIMETEAEETA